MSSTQTTVIITVVVVNWNRAEMLRECLQSLEIQVNGEGRRWPLATVVVDNGSTDGSQTVIKNEFPHVLLLENDKNVGYCAANNQGIRAAKGDLVALLNNDAAADPHWIQHLQSAFQAAPEVGMAASKIVTWDDPGRIDKAGHLIFPDGQNRGRGTGERDRGQYEKVEEVLWPDGCAAMYRRSMLDQIGGFDEDLFAYGDDAELGLRARIAGWRCLYMPRAVVRHRRGSTLGQGNPERVRLIERNRILLAAKLFPWSLLALNPIFFAIRMLAGIFSATSDEGDLAAFPGVRGKLRVAGALLRGQWQALMMLPLTLRKRAAIERMAVLTPAERRRLILSNRLSLRALSGIERGTEVRP
ncbi:MAG: glycosyltransferase family 2 protein [Bryobacteraceae bacterium]